MSSLETPPSATSHRTLNATRLVSLAFAVALSAITGRAELNCPAVFTDHMVLQREHPVPVWGTAKEGEKITVEFAGQTRIATADTAGHWRVDLTPLPASADSRTLTVRGTEETLTFNDVLVGEVWFCSGQSNMEKPLGPRKGQKPTDDYEAELARAACPTLRLFQMPHSGKAAPDSPMMHWQICDGTTLTNTTFSAAAYYFGRELVRDLGVPVGLIHASFGGTQIETWMPPEAFASNPILRGLENVRYEATKGTQATELYRTMVEPFTPYAVRGFLWYQGETNCMQAEGMLYADKQRALIASWRALWHEPDAPFYYALIAPFRYSTRKNQQKPVTVEELPLFWTAQIAALDVPHTGIITTTDIAGSMHDIHPTNKRDVGLRFARIALAETYGRHDVAAQAPRLRKAVVRGDHIELTFAEADGLRSRDGQPLTEFNVAGDDRKFVPATATISPDGHVTVASPTMAHPVAVRFAWHETANPNLVNAAGLPALPFRTDDWPVETEQKP